MKINKTLIFLYLNIYSFLLIGAGVLVLLIPFYKISLWIIILQVIVSIKLIIVGGKLFSTWTYKKRKVTVLTARNRRIFQPTTFEEYMQAPCGRLVVKVVLSKLDKSYEYKNLLKLKKPFLSIIKENCQPTKTIIYIREDGEKTLGG